MRFRSDTVLAAFVVALMTSFVTALAALLLKAISISAFDRQLFADITVNILLLIFFAGFVFIKGCFVAAWLLYRHDVPWGYELKFEKVAPIMAVAFIMSVALFSAVFLFASSEFIAQAATRI